MRILPALLSLALVVSFAAGQNLTDDKDDTKADDALAKTLKDADSIFTAKIGKLNALGQTNSIPPSTFGNITFKDAKALRGTPPAAAVPYSFREGAKNMDLESKATVLVAVKKGVTAIVPATEANLALAKKVIDARK